MLFTLMREITLHARAHSVGKIQNLNSVKSGGACKEQTFRLSFREYNAAFTAAINLNNLHTQI
jgi:hypothetical protein